MLSLGGGLTDKEGRAISIARCFRMPLLSDVDSLVIGAVLKFVEFTEDEDVVELLDEAVETVVASDVVLDMGLDDKGESIVVDADELLLFSDEDASCCKDWLFF